MSYTPLFASLPAAESALNFSHSDVSTYENQTLAITRLLIEVYTERSSARGTGSINYSLGNDTLSQDIAPVTTTNQLYEIETEIGDLMQQYFWPYDAGGTIITNYAYWEGRTASDLQPVTIARVETKIGSRPTLEYTSAGSPIYHLPSKEWLYWHLNAVLLMYLAASPGPAFVDVEGKSGIASSWSAAVTNFNNDTWSTSSSAIANSSFKLLSTYTIARRRAVLLITPPGKQNEIGDGRKFEFWAYAEFKKPSGLFTYYNPDWADAATENNLDLLTPAETITPTYTGGDADAVQLNSGNPVNSATSNTMLDPSSENFGWQADSNGFLNFNITGGFYYLK